MPEASIGLRLPWDIAASEAADARYEHIEPEHLFIGLCSLEKCRRPEVQRHLRLPDTAARALRAECETLLALLARCGIDPTIRREIRQRLGQGHCADNNRQSVSRSPASRALFTRAGELAEEAATVTTLHLLTAMLEEAGTGIVALLTEHGVDIAALRAVLDTVAVPPPAPRRLERPLLDKDGEDRKRRETRGICRGISCGAVEVLALLYDDASCKRHGDHLH